MTGSFTRPANREQTAVTIRDRRDERREQWEWRDMRMTMPEGSGIMPERNSIVPDRLQSGSGQIPDSAPGCAESGCDNAVTDAMTHAVKPAKSRKPVEVEARLAYDSTRVSLKARAGAPGCVARNRRGEDRSGDRH